HGGADEVGEPQDGHRDVGAAPLQNACVLLDLGRVVRVQGGVGTHHQSAERGGALGHRQDPHRAQDVVLPVGAVLCVQPQVQEEVGPGLGGDPAKTSVVQIHVGIVQGPV